MIAGMHELARDIQDPDEARAMAENANFITKRMHLCLRKAQRAENDT